MIPQNPDERAAIRERLKDVEGIVESLRKAGRLAVQEHARAGRKIPIWRNNQVVWELPKIEDGPEA